MTVSADKKEFEAFDLRAEYKANFEERVQELIKDLKAAGLPHVMLITTHDGYASEAHVFTAACGTATANHTSELVAKTVDYIKRNT
jgi:hypothetical protein